MEVVKLLEYLQDIIDTAQKVPFTNKVTINKNETMNVLQDIMTSLPDEFKKAQWVLNEKDRILSESIEEAEKLKLENIDILRRQVDQHDISREAQIKAEEIIGNAQREAKSLRLAARDYADELLSEMEKEIEAKGEQLILKLRSEMEEVTSSIENDILGSTSIIRDNIKELRNMK